jgi:helicase MOV-10
MAEVKNSGQNYRWPENLSEDFILPPKTNKSIQITAPPVKPSKSDSARSSQHDNPTPSYNGSTNLPSRPSSGSRTFPTRTVDQSGFLNEPPNKATLSVSEQASSAGIAGKPVVPSSITHLRPDDGLHHLLASRLAAESTLDIYASNYIPIWQTAINEAPASPRSCSPLGTIDYSAYISRFAGSRILSTVPPIRLPPIHSVPLRIDPSPGDLLPQWYGEYFSDALQNEITAHAKDLKTFSMYNVRFGIEDPIQYLYRFAIPGLREYSPRVDLGDVIRIRPLIAAPAHVQFTNRQRNLPPTPVFSGLEFHAIVWGISRQQEFIVLRIDGFMPTNFQTCNIIFVVQEHRYAPLWRSIDSTARSLNGLADGLWTRRPNAHRDSSSGSALSHPVPRPDSCSSPWLRQMLFPEECHAKMQSILSRGDFGVEWFDSQTNFEQRKAVDAVVTANYGSVPYLVCNNGGGGAIPTAASDRFHHGPIRSKVCRH